MHGDRKFIHNMRREYVKGNFLEEQASDDPFLQFEAWFSEAIESKLLDENAMTLSTCQNNRPSARIVLLKSYDHNGFVFFTNYGSQKSRELENNPYACLLFYWAEFERQIRINGTVEKTSRQESQEYFTTRPHESQVAAIASRQSQTLEDRKILDERFVELNGQLKDQQISLPEFWGGFRLKPDYFEFWQGRPNRLHDRIAYEQQESGWAKKRLYP